MLATVARLDDPAEDEDVQGADPRPVRDPGLAVLLHRPALGRRRHRPRRHPTRPRHGPRGRRATPRSPRRRTASSGCDVMNDPAASPTAARSPCRVMRTASAMGIRTVALFTDLDADAPHVRAADDAVRVESYLDIDAVVAAARSVGADAIHPGYGFLSERAAFARAVEAAGIKLVGPSADVMDRMGRKDAAREIADRGGRARRADGGDGRSGFPVLVKAAAGGGGKGMRIVRSAEEYDEAVAAAKREALVVVRRRHHARREVRRARPPHRGAGDGRRPRQRRRTSSSATAPPSAATRRCSRRRPRRPSPPRSASWSPAAPSRWRRHVGYENAGTVEFLLDSDTGEVYFLEMNTRLQVEHPVTEAITGLDLVELQLRVADGEPLPITQDDVTVTGHAIEARVYAEDSFGGFLPQAGTDVDRALARGLRDRLRPSSTTGPVRVDHALEPEQVVSTSYDPMLGKVIAHGATARTPGERWSPPSTTPSILGLTTNVGFLRALAASDEFRDATIDTAWLDTAEVERPDDELPPDLRRLGQRDAHGGHRQRSPVPVRRLAVGRRPGADDRRARPPGRRRPCPRHRRRHPGPAGRCRRPHAHPRRRRHAAPGGRQRPAARRRGGVPRPAVRVRAARRLRRPRASTSATARSPRRCPAPCSTYASPTATGSRPARCSSCWRR